MRNELEVAVNKAINAIAEDYYSQSHYDDDGHAFEMTWEDCIDHAREDFIDDIEGYMACEGVDVLTDEDEQEIHDYAWNDVSWATIKEMA